MVGDVAIEPEKMAAELAILHKTAAALEPGGVRCKLLIPNEQIKYLTLETENLTDAELDEAVRQALEGATPYTVDELVYDYSADGAHTHVAAVARETLLEAEAFAAEHKFGPICFAAVPGEQAYLGEPFFGETSVASDLLEDGDTVEPDGIAVVIIGEISTPSGPVAEVADTKAEDERKIEDPVATTSEVSTESLDEAREAGEAIERDSGEEELEADAPVMPLKDNKSGIDAHKVQTSATAATSASDETAHLIKGESATPEQSAENAQTVAETESSTLPPLKSAQNGTPDEAPQPTDPAEVPAPQEAPQPSDPPAPGIPNETPDPVDPMPTEPPRPDEVSIPTPAADATEFKKASSGAPALGGFASRRAAETSGSQPKLGGARRDAPVPGAGPTSVAAPQIAPVAEADIVPDSSSLSPDTEKAASKSNAASRFLSRRKPGNVPTAPPRMAAVATASAVVAEPTDEADRLTVFGARKGPDVGGKPRFLGLILTAALLVFLAGVAAWASVFLDDNMILSRLFGERSKPATAVVEEPATDPVLEAVALLPPPAEDVQDLTVTASLDPGLSDVDGAVLDALRAPENSEPTPLTEQQAEADYATSGIWPRAPEVPKAPAIIPLDDLYITSIDPVSTSNDAVAIPDAAGFSADQAFASLPSPAAAGTDFSLDDRGLVVPTAAGALSPDGVLVYLGAPPAKPPKTPTRFAAAPTVDPNRPQIVGQRPKARPSNLAETNERAVLGGLTRIELAAYRPQLRAPSVQEQAVAPTDAPLDASAAVAEALLVPPPAFQNATRLAVKASVRPDTRPRNFAQVVKRVQRTAPQPTTRVASTASVAPRTVKPSIPSKTSVAKQATVKNAIKLNRVNLIGVYGKPSSRRALVRLSNGRYRKVVVGDRIDGGRVSAIGDSELRYTKRGRDVILKMPRS